MIEYDERLREKLEKEYKKKMTNPKTPKPQNPLKVKYRMNTMSQCQFIII